MVLFRCPHCHAPLPEFTGGEGGHVCSQCGTTIEAVEGIPLLVRDRQRIVQAIQAAREDGRAAWYDQPQDIQLSGPYRHHIAKRIAYVKQVLTRHIDGLGRVPIALDLGCGDGNNLAWLGDLPVTLMASDYNLNRLLRARRRAPGIRLFMADVTDYPMLDDSLDIIFFNHVLEHIPDDTAALREVYRILRPGGLLVLGVPNEGAFFWRLAYRLQPSVRANSDHLHFYTASVLEGKCRECGFIVQETHALGWGLPHWTLDALVRRWKWVDDLFETVGKRLFPTQATSLYLILRKPDD
ncbi:MAG: class I SAM-dependent methyltransferase [Thiobacillaceae bacterium]|jgi:SAM-dependent methyltransferase|nr:class I SAM-dependent methyltransferase [Thiobacillaceae bacterium]